jgi:hypothetical protein
LKIEITFIGKSSSTPSPFAIHLIITALLSTRKLFTLESAKKKSQKRKNSINIMNTTKQWAWENLIKTIVNDKKEDFDVVMNDSTTETMMMAETEESSS